MAIGNRAITIDGSAPPLIVARHSPSAATSLGLERLSRTGGGSVVEVQSSNFSLLLRFCVPKIRKPKLEL